MAYNFASARFCCQCGGEFFFKVKITAESSSHELIAGNAPKGQEPIEEMFVVKTVTYSKHIPWNGKKRGPFNRSVASLRVTYNCEGLRAFTEFVCFEHGGHASAMAAQWWAEGCRNGEPPTTIDAALASADSLQRPAKIRVWINRANPQIQYREF
jgi:DNA repair protein RadD